MDSQGAGIYLPPYIQSGMVRSCLDEVLCWLANIQPLKWGDSYTHSLLVNYRLADTVDVAYIICTKCMMSFNPNGEKLH